MPKEELDRKSVDLSGIVQPLVVRTAISLIVLAASLFVILATRYTPQDKHWGYATVGVILGYWLKGK